MSILLSTSLLSEDLPKPKKRWVIAYSGGMDSHVLLHLAVETFGTDALLAFHVNHQLSLHSKAWAEHCHSVCEALNVRFICQTVSVNKTGNGLEADAREARYLAFESFCEAGDVLLQAHHADDQVETFFMRIFRGAGIDGLKGIPAKRPLKKSVWIARPFLNVPRSVLAEYASSQSLSWIEDESNQDLSIDRNYFRHMIGPQIAKHWPQYQRSSLQSVSLINLAHSFQDKQIDRLLKPFLLPEKNQLLLSGFDVLDNYEKSLVLRQWLAINHFEHLSQKLLNELLNAVKADQDRIPKVHIGGRTISRYQHKLYIYTETTKPSPEKALEWNMVQECLLFDGSVLKLEESSSLGYGLTVRSLQMKVEIRYRSHGERCRPVGRSRTQTLKKLMQEFKVEPWLRHRVPLIYINDELAAMGDYFICDKFSAKDEEYGLKLCWIRHE